MIKSLIILILLVVALGGAALSRPSQENFIQFYTDRAEQQHTGLTAAFERGAYAEYAKSYTYNNDMFWATASKDGKSAFTGVFNHWFVNDETLAKPAADLKSLLK